MRLIAIIAMMAALGCRDRTSCLEVAKRADAAETIARCTVEYEQTRDPRAAVAAVTAHVARAKDSKLQGGGVRDVREDDDAVVAWANRVGDVPEAALIWRRAAQVHERRGQREAMLAAGHRALELWAQAGANGEAAYEARVLQQAYWSESQLLPALLAARRARALALASDDQEMQRVSLGGLFSLLDEIGDQRGAAAVLEEARKTLPDDAQARYFLHFNEGLLRFHEQRFELARLAYRQALALPDAVKTADFDRAALYNLVESDVALGELDAAARDLSAAVAKLPAEPPLHMRCARAFFTGLLARAQRDPARAEAAVREPLAASPLADWVWQLEHVLGGALEDQGRRDEAIAAYRRAIATVEQMRRDLAIDVLQLHLRDRKRAPYEAVFELEAAAGHRDAAMAVAELMWRRGFVESFATTVDASGAADRAADRVRGVTAVMPLIARRMAATDAARARDPENDLLAFVQARGALWRYSRTELDVRLERVPMSAVDAGRLVAALRARPDDPAVAGQLGEVLIPRLAITATRQHRPLVVVVDGVLSGLSFAGLRIEGHWLIEKRVLAYQPGLDPVAPGSEPQAMTTAVVMAPTGQPGGSLPASGTEATDVARALGVTPLLGTQANLAALRGARAASLLHVAAHGGIAPAGAFLRLADGEITVTDVIRWGLAPRVVVLASCASGARAGGSLWGAMGGGFLAAGSRAVVATLWSVEDAATAAVIRAFYAAHGDQHPHAALAAAQRQAITAGMPPRQWASFVVLGAP